jgi:hypothetical protein
MARMMLVAFQIEGDAAAISAALETVRGELGRLAGPAALPVGDARGSAPAPQLSLNGSTHKSYTPRSSTPKVAPPARASRPDKDKAKEPRSGSMQEKALAVIRSSHQGVTSEDIYKAVNCVTIPSAYQLCLELVNKGLVKRLDNGPWKAV